MIFNKFSQLVPEENVWIPVRRFCILTLGLNSPEAKTPKLGFRTMIGSEKV